MIKVEVVETKQKTTKLYFETRDTSSEGLEELDRLYQALLGSEPRIGGYTDSNKFTIEVKNGEAEA